MSTNDPSTQLVARPPLHPASFDRLNPTRCDEIYLYNLQDPHNFRYKLKIVDRRLELSSKGDGGSNNAYAYATAVFIIPAGRESEYMFHSQHGLQAIAMSAQTARLIAVSLGRHHEFRSQTEIQAELTFTVQVLSRQGNFLHKNLRVLQSKADIPFMALDGIGQRNIIAQGETKWSGSYVVEQVLVGSRQIRRLYFMDNPFVIQSEVGVIQEQADGEKDESNVAIVDKSFVAFEYHKTIAAGILGFIRVQEEKRMNGLLIGLGGGGLVHLLFSLFSSSQQARYLDLTAIELDPVVADVASEYFGLKEYACKCKGEDGEVRDCQMDSSDLADNRGKKNLPSELIFKIGDGLKVDSCPRAQGDAAIENSGDPSSDALIFPPESFAFCIIDVDAKDKTVGMSCPPKAFVETSYLKVLSGLLVKDGILAINVSARDPKMLDQVCRNVSSVFSEVIVSSKKDVGQEQNDLNVVVFVSQLIISQDNVLEDQDEEEKEEKNLEQDTSRMENFQESTKHLVSFDAELLSDLVECLESLEVWKDKSSAPRHSHRSKKKNKKRGKKR